MRKFNQVSTLEKRLTLVTGVKYLNLPQFVLHIGSICKSSIMEWKLGSVVLLMSCSLQQSLWGILASVPQTTADRCKQKISSGGEEKKRVQMIRRIPARCSGWDEAWSWLSSKDCRTKYMLDYVELPSIVQKTDPEDCEEEVRAPTEQGHFSLADEKYLAIAFGSATVALLILIIIIIVSVCRRGSNRCCLCSTGPAYTSANASEAEDVNARTLARNVYVDEEMKLAEPMYEEIHDQSTAKRKLEFSNDLSPPDYENGVKDQKAVLVDNLSRPPVTPSAPYEEDLPQKSVPNEYSVLKQNLVQKLEEKLDQDKPENKSKVGVNKVITNGGTQSFSFDEISNDTDEDKDLPEAGDDMNIKQASSGFQDVLDVPSELKDVCACSTIINAETPIVKSRSDNSDVVEGFENEHVSVDEGEDAIRQSLHSYENLNRSLLDEGDYELLTRSPNISDLCSSPAEIPVLTEGCVGVHALVEQDTQIET